MCIPSLFFKTNYIEFTDHFTHLAKLFLAVGNTELSNKMSYKRRQKEFIIKTFYSSGGSCVAVVRRDINDKNDKNVVEKGVCM
jgi:hypothetical protein